jgi:methyl-accepting chemotaxis protein
MTATDKFFDSGIGTVLGGFVNQIWSQNSDPFATDVAALESVGSSYGGTAADISEAAKNADKKYGLFSSKARRKANEFAKKVAATQNIMSDVANTATDQRLAVQSMGEQAGLAYSMMADGGYN